MNRVTRYRVCGAKQLFGVGGGGDHSQLRLVAASEKWEAILCLAFG